MSTFDQILRETDRGLRPARVAERLRLPVDVVSAALEHAQAVGLVTRFEPGCSDCGVERPACAGCPLASRRPAGGTASARR